MRGPPGLPGPKGEPGERGYRGEKGTKGDTGSPGRFPRAIPLRDSRERRMTMNDIFPPRLLPATKHFLWHFFQSDGSSIRVLYIVDCLCVDVDIVSIPRSRKLFQFPLPL